MAKKNKKKGIAYFFENKKGFYLYDTGLHMGRAFLRKGKIFDIDRKSHPKMVASIKKLGTQTPCN